MSSILLLSLALPCGCGGDERLQETPDGGSERDAGGEHEGPTSAPKHGPEGLVFEDADPACDRVGGEVVLRRAANEADVTSYALYFGTSPTTKHGSTPIALIPKTGHDLTFTLPSTPRPAEASYLLAFAHNEAGESPVGASVAIDERFQVVATGLPVGEPGRLGDKATLLLDPVSKDLLVVTPGGDENDDVDGLKPTLFRCNPDGTACTSHDISAGQPSYTGLFHSAQVDEPNGKLLVTTFNGRGPESPLLFRCNLDGTGCTSREVSSGQAFGLTPYLLVDPSNEKALVLISDGANDERPALFRCDLDGSNCTYHDISAGRGPRSGRFITGALDAVAGKVLVVTADGSNEDRPALFRCNVDGTDCTYHDISVGQPAMSGEYPSVAIDPLHGKLLVVTADYSRGEHPALFRCNLDGTDCTYRDLSADRGGMPLVWPSVLIDRSHDKLLVLGTHATEQRSSLMVFECNLDGTSCMDHNLSEGLASFGGFIPSGLVQMSPPRLLAVAKHVTGGITLFKVCL